MFSLFPFIAKVGQQRRYYAFDEPLVRELLGKKMSHRVRRELEYVSPKTAVSFRSGRRQVLLFAFMAPLLAEIVVDRLGSLTT